MDEPLLLPLGDELGVDAAVRVPVPVLEDVGVCDRLSVLEDESLPELLPVFEGLAPFVNEAVGVREIERESDCVLDGV